MATWKDWLRKAHRAKDAAELEQIEKEAAPEMERAGENGDHVHIHLPGRDEPEGAGGGGGEGGQIQTRLEAMERDMEEMKADHQEMMEDLDDLLDEGSGESLEDARRRIRDRKHARDDRARHRRRDARRDDGRRDDSRREDDARRREDDARRDDDRRREDDRRRHLDDARRRHHDLRKHHDDNRRDDDDWRRDDDALRKMDDDLRRDECTMDKIRRHDDDMKRMDDARRARDEGAAGSNEKIEGELELEAPPGTGDKARKARDSAYLEDSWQETVAMAEIIIPGQRFPTFDRAAAPAKGLAAICDLRKRTLDLAHAKPELRGFIDHAVGGDYVVRSKTMDCASTRLLFRTIAGMQRDRNNSGEVGHHTNDRGFGGGQGAIGVRSLADLQKKNDEFWANQAR